MLYNVGSFFYEGHGDGASRLTTITNRLSRHTFLIKKVPQNLAPHRHHCD